MGTDERSTMRVLIANDHPVICEGLRTMLAETREFTLVGCATSMPEAIRMVGDWQPGVLLVDPYMQGQDGFRAIEMIRGEWPHVAVIVLTSHKNEELMLRCLHVGASAYLTLHTDRAGLLHALRTAVRGETLLRLENVAWLLASATAAVSKSVPSPSAGEKGPGPELTKREREILQRVASGERNKEIAAHLCISEPTVKSHLVAIYFKLGVDSRASAVAVGMERGLIER
ncbi:MAG: response regulator transcription factor [Ktedonobacteraceae bacterium]|nr:response regulator transcription factor [Ktedonobacteraceae bacterium]